MSNQAQRAQLAKFLRALACSGVIIGPYMYTMARPEETLQYRFIQALNEKGEYQRVDSSYNRLATEIAYRTRLPEQMRRTPQFDIRSRVHTGLDFDINGHFTPLFNGIAYLMVPQWANVSSMEDLKKVKIEISGHSIDFSKIDLTKLDQRKLNRLLRIPEEPPKPVETIAPPPNESKSWFNRRPTDSPAPTPEAPPPPAPLTRELLLVDRLIDTFFLSDDAKKYIIADQFEIASGPWHMVPWLVVAGSFFLPFSLYTRLRQQFRTRFKRFLFLHFLLLNGLLCFYLSPFLGRLLNMQISRIRDYSSTSEGFDLLEGAIEFLEKEVERRRILRELLPNGPDFFEQDGERTRTRVHLNALGGLTIPIYHWYPLLNYRLKKLRARLDKLLSLPEDQVRKKFFKSPN